LVEHPAQFTGVETSAQTVEIGGELLEVLPRRFRAIVHPLLGLVDGVHHRLGRQIARAERGEQRSADRFGSACRFTLECLSVLLVRHVASLLVSVADPGSPTVGLWMLPVACCSPAGDSAAAFSFRKDW